MFSLGVGDAPKVGCNPITSNTRTGIIDMTTNTLKEANHVAERRVVTYEENAC